MKGVTLYKGEPHVTSKDAGALNCAAFGTDNRVASVGDAFRSETISNNVIRVHSGEGFINGRQFRIPHGEFVDFHVENGESGYQRNDLLCMRYSIAANGVESIEPVAIKGDPGASATDPAYNDGSVYEGDSIVDFPLYRVKLDGINVSAVNKLFQSAPSLGDFWPVGSIYMTTTSSVHPGVVFGGTWDMVGAGTLEGSSQTEYIAWERKA